MRDKKGLVLFHWILILIVGAVIIIFGIMFASKTGMVEQKKQNIVVVEYLDLFFNPFAEIGSIAGGVGKSVELPYESEVNLRCVAGEERLRIGEGSKVAEKKIENFVYAPSKLKTKNFFVFSKPFEIPFRVGDLIFAFDSSQNFCLIYDPYDSASSGIASEIDSDVRSSLLAAGDNFVLCTKSNCCNSLDNPKVISFTSQKGDVNIIGNGPLGEEFSYGEIDYNGTRSYFIGTAMIEGAIFSDYEIYGCNFKRLMEKVSAITEIYAEKASFLDKTQTCSYNLFRADLSAIKNAANSLSATPSLAQTKTLYEYSEELKDKNIRFNCVQIY